MATRRPTKSFIVEYKRNPRSASRSSTIQTQTPDRAVEYPRPAARKFVNASHAAASAVFQKVDETRPAIEMPLVARRILPVIVAEKVATPEPETVSGASAARDPAPKVTRKVSRPKTKATIQPVEASTAVKAEQTAVPVAPEAVTPSAVRALSIRRVSRLKKVDDDLPRSQRWKRRLPTFMR